MSGLQTMNGDVNRDGSQRQSLSVFARSLNESCKSRIYRDGIQVLQQKDSQLD